MASPHLPQRYGASLAEHLQLPGTRVPERLIANRNAQDLYNNPVFAVSFAVSLPTICRSIPNENTLKNDISFGPDAGRFESADGPEQSGRPLQEKCRRKSDAAGRRGQKSV